MKLSPEDCRTCGACCVAVGDGSDVLTYGYADLDDDDVRRMSRHVRGKLLTIFVGGETRQATRAKELASGAFGCQHLRGTPGKRCSCTIYASRPAICRQFRVGSVMCGAARAVLAEASLKAD